MKNTIKIRRMRWQLTQNQLADRLHTTQQTIARWETGKTEISASQLRDLAVVFECSVDELLGIETPPEEQRKSAFALVNHDVPFGTALAHFSFGKLEYPIDEATAERISKQLKLDLAGLDAVDGWLELSTLNNKLVFLNPTAVRQLAIISDDAEEMPEFYHPEVYRSLHDADAEVGPELRAKIESLRENLSEEEINELTDEAKIVFLDGTSEQFFLDDEGAMGAFVLALNSFHIPANSFVRMQSEGGYVQKMFNLSHVAAIEVPFEKYLRLNADEFEEVSVS